MKLLKFLGKTILVFTGLYILSWILTYILFKYGTDTRVDIDPAKNITEIIAFAVSLPMTAFILLMLEMLRKNKLFWKYFKEAESKSKKLTTLTELQNFYNIEILTLNKLASGTIHYMKLSSLHSYILGKFDQIKNNENTNPNNERNESTS